jgi:hypothetical protein
LFEDLRKRAHLYPYRYVEEDFAAGGQTHRTKIGDKVATESECVLDHTLSGKGHYGDHPDQEHRLFNKQTVESAIDLQLNSIQ